MPTPLSIPPTFHLADSLAWLHGKRRREIYVLLSADGSTLVRDPGLGRPWSSPNKLLADHHAANITRESKGAFKCSAVDIETALASVLKHPKNLPKEDN